MVQKCPKNLYLKFQPSRINIKLSRTLLFCMTFLPMLWRTLEVHESGFMTRKAYEWLNIILMYLGLKFEVSRKNIMVSSPSLLYVWRCRWLCRSLTGVLLPVKYIYGLLRYPKVPMSKTFSFYDEYKGVKDPPVIYVFITGVLEDTGCSWMGINNQNVYGWLGHVPWIYW